MLASWLACKQGKLLGILHPCDDSRDSIRRFDGMMLSFKGTHPAARSIGEGMIAFKIEIDGEEVVTAGFDDWSILALHVNASRGDPISAFARAREDEVRFSVGGLSGRDDAGAAHHVRWKERLLEIGSQVTVKVVDTDRPDFPLNRYRSDANIQESPFTDEELKEMRWQDYLELKKEFEG